MESETNDDAPTEEDLMALNDRMIMDAMVVIDL